MSGHSMIHCNGNLLACVDVETTGLKPRHNDIIQVCVLVLNSDLKPSQEIVPFYGEMQPKRPHNVEYEAMRVNKINYFKLVTNSLDADRMADLFEEWFERLPLTLNKKIMPLAHNWPFDREFLIDWLGQSHFDHFFHGHYRDLQAAALLENDKADHMIQQTPFPKLGLQYLCSCLKVPRTRPHESMQDCIATAECYRRLLKQGAAVIKVTDG